MMYFDNAATTFPKPKRVLEKWMDVSSNYCANPGRSGHQMALRMDREIFEVREKLTKFVGAENSMNTIFAFNTTDALNKAIHGVVKKGMHVVTTSMEHNSVLRPLKTLEEQGQITLTVVFGDENGYVDSSKIIDAITDDTSLVVTTQMSNLVGTIIDVEKIGKICREKGIIYIVDAAQSMGILDIDVAKMNIDILCFPAHKGLLAPMGLGGMVIREGISVEPIIQGGTGSFSSSPYQPTIYPDALESGTENGPAIIALGEALNFIEEVGLNKIREHEDRLKNLFIENLRDENKIKLYGTLDERQGAVVSLNIEGMDSSELGYILSSEYEIAIRPGLHCAPLAHQTIGTTETGTARFSFGYFNTEEEVIKASKILKEIAGKN